MFAGDGSCSKMAGLGHGNEQELQTKRLAQQCKCNKGYPAALSAVVVEAAGTSQVHPLEIRLGTASSQDQRSESSSQEPAHKHIQLVLQSNDREFHLYEDKHFHQ
jgi:hypothetical protein